ncbi:MAG: hypothetical protein IBX50_07670 [Marinospirillum sp.]|uniref:hypothetical protein n=1 Tax=Marinospirillum sp. TaxID=2183934 RepID=UPI0019F27D38|nr:hypothetical protein [Marinospirillum sp.]MBE0506585.1 hypothetical protein [Marinospirillum sp.]
MKTKLNAAHRGFAATIATTKEKTLAFGVLIMMAGSAHAQEGGPAFNPLTLISNLAFLLQNVEMLLGMIFSFLGFLLTGFGIYTAVQVLRGAQSVQRMENPWAYVAGAVILGPILMGAGVVMTGMWDALTVTESAGGAGW